MKSLLRWFGRSPSSRHVPAAQENPEALIAKGNICEDRGEFEAARGLYQRAVALSPGLAQAHMNLGNALANLDHRHAALASYRKAIELQSDLVPAYLNIGVFFLANGDLSAAEDAYRHALQLAPESSSAWFGLGCALDSRSDEADAAFRETLALVPGHAGAAARLAQRLRARGRARDALRELRLALKANPGEIPLLHAQAEILGGAGESAAACAIYRQILASTPHDWGVWNNLLWTLNFMPEMDAAKILAEHRKYADALKQVLEPMAASPARCDRKRLKIGYVSADFRRHSISCFIEPVLRHCDRERFEVHCFYNYASGDEITQRLFELTEHWHDISGLSDADAARRIRDNGIDILVDLAGHTAHNRLGVFALKPAHLQFTWLGYLCTTGLHTIDYRVCDAHTDPPGQAEAWQIETPLRLPDSQWCYQPQVELPPPSPLPRLANGYWTFGSFNQESKLNAQMLRAWAGVLLAVSGSRLRVMGVTCDLAEERIRDVLSAQGVGSERVDIVGRLSIDGYLAAYRDVDIALDTFPYNGATTTCDALLMGVPVATVAGNRAIARGGESLLTTMGLRDWVVSTPDALAEMVSAQIASLQHLVALRQALPLRMRASALMDGATFAKNLEALFEQAWRRT